MKIKLSFGKYLLSSLFLTFLFSSFFFKLFSQQNLIEVNGWNAYVHLPWDYSQNPSKTYATIIFFPGKGEVGKKASLVIANGPGAYIRQGWNGNVKAGADSVKFIVISLQPLKRYPRESLINDYIQALKRMYRIDPKRLHLTGLSMGGWCGTTFVTGDPAGGPYTYASQVATVVEVEGVRPDDNSPYPYLFDNFAKNNGRLLGFEQVRNGMDTKTRIDRMNHTRENSAIFVSTNFGNGGHCCWEQFYGGNGVEPGKFLLDGKRQNIYEWIAANSSPSTEAVNHPPVADAGPDVVILQPANSVTLYGSATDPDGTIISYTWTQISGPSKSTIKNTAQTHPTMENLEKGIYVFQLQVTDNKGATATNKMQLTVKPPVDEHPTGPAKYIKVNVYGGSNPYNNSSWNNWNVGTGSNSNITSGLLKFSDGSVSNINAVLSYSQAVGDNASNYPGGMVQKEVLRHASYSQQSRTLTLSGLNTSLKYNIELYASRWSTGNSTIFSVNENSVTIATYRNFTNKATFTNITPNTWGQIIVNIRSATRYNYLNGFIITQQSNDAARPLLVTDTDSLTPDMASLAAGEDETSYTNTKKSFFNKATAIEVFPNPATDQVILLINNPQFGIINIQIINVNGTIKTQFISKHSSPVSKINIPVNELPAGIYVIKIRIGNWVAFKKITKL